MAGEQAPAGPVAVRLDKLRKVAEGAEASAMAPAYVKEGARAAYELALLQDRAIAAQGVELAELRALAKSLMSRE